MVRVRVPQGVQAVTDPAALTPDEQEALLNRERQRMAEPGYRETLESPPDGLIPAALTDEELRFELNNQCELCRARIGHNLENHRRSLNDSIQSEGISRHIRGLDG